MLFTVLMCAHRDDDFVMPAVQSVLQQTDANFELLIVLNGCPDSLPARLQALGDPRIVLHRTAIRQLGFNLNVGAQLARGQYLVRFDADDLCHPERLQRTREILAQHPDADLVAGSCRRISVTGEVIGHLDVGGDWRRALNWKNPFVHPAVAIRRDCLLRMRGYAGGLHSEDYELWLRMAEEPDIRVVTSSFPMIDYRTSPQQASGTVRGYAEVAGYMWTSFLARPRPGRLLGVMVAAGKVVRAWLR
ncbi:glycosyltransferase family A protein [Pseudorhodoferax sp. Leaf267]|uniref:glycosyltransferase family 2 protein n=1 Tax=Pseudorhodoferax sp. Leaf267 TaxID=1736316 RepID=UPI0006FE145B|nr:glycosyltransferase family A protein [Pseudorhodoferax sp. Leaf267]KQP14325.1 hypothetical protein ASF43_16055 [Pseudorhodoferax sp. Leaf267]